MYATFIETMMLWKFYKWTNEKMSFVVSEKNYSKTLKNLKHYKRIDTVIQSYLEK